MTTLIIFLSITFLALAYCTATMTYRRKTTNNRNRMIRLLNMQSHQWQQDHILREIENQLTQ